MIGRIFDSFIESIRIKNFINDEVTPLETERDDEYK